MRRASACTSLCPHFHLSLQSGSEGVLRRMRRHYTGREYAEHLSVLRTALPHAAVTTDVIVGFPGESEAEFEESLRFVRDCHFARIHVFPFSPRAGTPAAAMPDQLPRSVKAERVQRMIAAGKESQEAYQGAMLQRVQRVLFEAWKDGFASGYTDSYQRCRVPSERSLTGQLLPVRLLDTQGDILSAALLPRIPASP